MIAISQLLHALLIRYYINKNKTKSISKELSLELLCYLSNCIKSNYRSFWEFESYISKSNSNILSNLLHDDFYASILQYSHSVNKFLDIFDLISDLFVEDKNADQTGLSGPNYVTRDSVMGLFLRTFLLEWESQSFEQCCDKYEEFSHFLLSQESYDTNSKTKMTIDSLIHAIGTNDDIINAEPDEGLDEISKIMFNVYKYLSFNDITTAEKYIHQYYDYNGSSSSFESFLTTLSLNNNSSTVSAAGGNTITKSNNDYNKKIASLLSDLRNHEEDSIIPYTSATRHQQALLGLSLLWMKSSSSSLSRLDTSPLALNSLEEGLKIAHQRDDHVSVAKALLLLYQQTNDEELLIRCIDRCVTLNQRFLASQAALLLVQHRLKHSILVSRLNNMDVDVGPHPLINLSNILAPSENSIGTFDLQSSKHENTLQTVVDPANEGYAPQTAWMLLYAGLYGDMKLTSITSKLNDVVALDKALTEHAKLSASSVTNVSLSAGMPTPPPLASAAAAVNGYQETCLTYEEYLSISLQAKIIAKNMWLRYFDSFYLY